MGQKVNPNGLRVGVIRNWDSRWFVSDRKFGDTLVSDYNIRKYLKKELQPAGVPKIEIERDNQRVRIFIHCAKPGLVIGKGGVGIEKYRNELTKMVGMPVALNVVEVRQPDLNAQLVAENVAAQLEKRIAFRRAMKMAIRNAMRLGAKGIKISCGGRLGGAEIARTEHYHEGTILLRRSVRTLTTALSEHHLRQNRRKGWIYKGEILNEVNRTSTVAPREPRRRDDRRDNSRRPFGGDRKPSGGGNRRPDGGNRTPREGGRR